MMGIDFKEVAIEDSSSFDTMLKKEIKNRKREKERDGEIVKITEEIFFSFLIAIDQQR